MGVWALLTRAPPIGIPPSSKPSLACWMATSIFSRSLANGSFVGRVATKLVPGSSISRRSDSFTEPRSRVGLQSFSARLCQKECKDEFSQLFAFR